MSKKPAADGHKSEASGTPRSPDNAEWWVRFRKLLDEQNEWPTTYLFKFIAPKEQSADLQAVFEGEEITVRASSKGNYQSITSHVRVKSAEHVVTLYRRASAIEGVISL